MRRPGVKRPWLLPLVLVYWAGLWVKNRLVDAGVLQVRRLGWPVVSVGSLSAGGAGKTPVVKMLAQLLARHGVEVDVLSRGYRRTGGGVARVELTGDGLDAARFGDEPVEMARAGLRVWVGSERLEAGRAAEEAWRGGLCGDGSLDGGKANTGILHCVQDDSLSKERGVHLLDDGFQHRRLGRELDVVLLTRADVADWLLPAGNLREPLGELRRAQVVVVREDEAAEVRPVAERFGAAVWMVRRRLVLPEGMPRSPLVFCGLARPEGFFGMVAAAGADVAGTMAFPDHHAYEQADFARLLEAARGCGADGFVTTAKDVVKLGAAAFEFMGAVGLVVVAELVVELVDEDLAWERLRGLWPD